MARYSLALHIEPVPRAHSFLFFKKHQRFYFTQRVRDELHESPCPSRFLCLLSLVARLELDSYLVLPRR